MLFDLIDYYYTFAHYNGIFVYLGQGQGKWKDFSIDKQNAFSVFMLRYLIFLLGEWAKA